MTEKMNGINVNDWAKRRRKLVELENRFFRSRTHTSVEILVFLAENEFHSKLSAIYENTQATDASVRQHLRALEKLKFVSMTNDGNDGRAKIIAMTDYGRRQLEHYTEELANLMSANGL